MLTCRERDHDFQSGCGLCGFCQFFVNVDLGKTPFSLSNSIFNLLKDMEGKLSFVAISILSICNALYYFQKFLKLFLMEPDLRTCSKCVALVHLQNVFISLWICIIFPAAARQLLNDYSPRPTSRRIALVIPQHLKLVKPRPSRYDSSSIILPFSPSPTSEVHIIPSVAKELIYTSLADVEQSTAIQHPRSRQEKNAHGLAEEVRFNKSPRVRPYRKRRGRRRACGSTAAQFQRQFLPKLDSLCRVAVPPLPPV